MIKSIVCQQLEIVCIVLVPTSQEEYSGFISCPEKSTRAVQTLLYKEQPSKPGFFSLEHR